MTIIMLTAEERIKFAMWCEQDADGTLGLVDQMERIGISEQLIKKRKAEALAQQVVAKLLRSIETTQYGT